MKNTFYQMKKILLLFLLVFPAVLNAKNFKIKNVDITANIQKDGTIEYQEKRTYYFEGDFTWANYVLPKKGYDSISNIQIQVNGKFFVNENSKKSGTFQINDSRKKVELKWFFDAADEHKTFAISYTLHGAIVPGNDYSEFYWTYLSDNWKKDTKDLKVSVNLPEESEPDNLFLWQKGKNEGLEIQKSRNGFSLAAENINKHQTVAVRLLFPTNILSFPEEQITSLTLQQVKDEERKQEIEQEKRRVRKEVLGKYDLPVAILLLLISAGIFYMIFSRFGIKYTIQEKIPGRLYEPPTDDHPALVGWLMNERSTSSFHLTASIFDLARKGYFQIVEQEDKKWHEGKGAKFKVVKTGKEPSDSLKDFELMLLNFINDRIEEGKGKFDELFKDTSLKAPVNKFLIKWHKAIKEKGKEKIWFDYTSIKWSSVHAFLQILIMIVSIAFLIIGFGKLLLFATGIALIMAIMSLAIIRKTYKGEVDHKKWSAYKNGLKEASPETVNSDPELNYIYAIALGLGKKSIENIFSHQNEGIPIFVWLVILNPSISPVSAAQALSTLAATGTSSFGGAAGGGASAGSAGGGAGGGAG
jgi:uncharacterized membrane protein